MEKEFIPYEQALTLKELGFDEPCLAYYIKEATNLDKEGNKTNFVLLSAKLRGELVGHGTVKNNLFKWLKYNDRTSGELYTLSHSVTAPLYQQAFRWFRDKYSLTGLIEIGTQEYSYNIFNEKGNTILGNDRFNYNGTYEEAELECLKKLIEIVKSK